MPARQKYVTARNFASLKAPPTAMPGSPTRCCQLRPAHLLHGGRVWGATRRWNGAQHPTFRPISGTEGFGLVEAREAARTVLGRNAGARSDTFSNLAADFLLHGRTKRGRALRASTIKEYRRALLTYAAGLHRKPVGEIRRGDVAEVIRATANGRGTTTAMRTRAALSRFWSWLVANDKVDANVVTGTEGYETAKRERVLLDGELAVLWSATQGDHDLNLIVRLMLWTGCRRAEAGGMRWSELVDDIWTVPGSRTKNHRALMLPLPPQALALLDARSRLVGRDFVFGRGPTGFQAWSQSKRRLDARLGFARSWDLHDIRRTVETRMAALGIPKDHVNKVLNHAAGPVTAAYDQWSYVPEKRAALDAWARELARVVGRGEVRVVELQTAG